MCVYSYFYICIYWILCMYRIFTCVCIQLRHVCVCTYLELDEMMIVKLSHSARAVGRCPKLAGGCHHPLVSMV